MRQAAEVSLAYAGLICVLVYAFGIPPTVWEALYWASLLGSLVVGAYSLLTGRPTLFAVSMILLGALLWWAML